MLPRVASSGFSKFGVNNQSSNPQIDSNSKINFKDEEKELSPDRYKNKDWYKDEVKEFRVSPSNGIPTLVFTIEPKHESPPPVVITRTKEKKKTKISQVSGGDQEGYNNVSFSTNKRRISGLTFQEPLELPKDSLESDKKVHNKAEVVGKRRSFLGFLVESSTEKLKSLHELEEVAEVKKKTDHSLAFDSQTHLDSRSKKSMYRSQQSTMPTQRKRILEIKPIDRVNLFEGLPYVQYDAFLRRDPTMQNLITRDVLKVLVDKCNNLRVTLLDKGKILEIYNQLNQYQKQNLNKKLEDTTVILYKISNLILQEFQTKTKKLGIMIPHIFLEDQKTCVDKKEITEELEVAKINISEYMEVFEYFRDSVDCYFIIARQRDRKGLDDRSCVELLKLIGKCRYNTGEILEEFRVHEIIINDKFRWKENPAGKRASQNYTQSYLEKMSQTTNALNSGIDPAMEEKARKFKAVNNLLQNKFNFSRGKAVTRESKIVLNQDKFENEKNLLMKSNNKKYRQQMKETKADNRIKIKLERLQNPFKVPEIREALKVMKNFPNYSFGDEMEDLV